jgi:hypothetical protein
MVERISNFFLYKNSKNHQKQESKESKVNAVNNNHADLHQHFFSPTIKEQTNKSTKIYYLQLRMLALTTTWSTSRHSATNSS